MTDETVITMADGSRWRPATSREVVRCVTCSNEVDTPEEIASYPDGNCPNCGSSWTGEENRSTMIQVTMPDSITGGAG
jgi:predicted RNA-binding Zn-ribbon protein involved in translation (DUF1610 family)